MKKRMRLEAYELVMAVAISKDYDFYPNKVRSPNYDNATPIRNLSSHYPPLQIQITENVRLLVYIDEKIN